jgi:hypothetical protein
MKNIIAKSTQGNLTLQIVKPWLRPVYLNIDFNPSTMEPHLCNPKDYADYMRTLTVSCLSRLQDYSVAQIRHETISPILKEMAASINKHNQTECDPYLFELGCCLVKQANINMGTQYARAVSFLKAQKDGKEPPRIFPPHIH